MGMNLYNASPAARAVWESADAHLLAVYGFSIIEIVKDNLKEKTVHFGGIKGQAIRQRYIDMTYDTMDKDRSIKTLPLFADIDSRTPKYTFQHPTGLLFATQFAQIALVVTEKAAFEDLRVKDFVQRDCAFAGHSLGEYSAFASIADVIPVASLVDIGRTITRGTRIHLERRLLWHAWLIPERTNLAHGRKQDVRWIHFVVDQVLPYQELGSRSVALRRGTAIRHYSGVPEAARGGSKDLAGYCCGARTHNDLAYRYVKVERVVVLADRMGAL
jgi:hypothetical protein